MYVYIYLCISSTILLKNVHDIQTTVFHFACGDTQTSRSMALWLCGSRDLETPGVFIAVTNSIIFKLSSRPWYDAVLFSIWGLMSWMNRLPTLPNVLYRTEKTTNFSEMLVTVQQYKRRHITTKAAVRNTNFVLWNFIYDHPPCYRFRGIPPTLIKCNVSSGS